MTTPPIVTANKLNLLGLINQAMGELGLPQYNSIVGNQDSQAIQLLSLAQREGKEFYQIAHRKGGWEELNASYKFNTAAIKGLTGNITNGSAIITGISSTTGIVAGLWAVSGNGIPNATRVLSVDSPTQITMDSNATLTASSVSLSFGQDAYPLPNDLGYLQTQTAWDRTYRWQLLGPLSAQEWQVLKSGISPTGPRRRYRIMGNYFYIDPVPSDSNGVEVFEYYSNSWCQSIGGVGQSSWKADTDYYTLDDDCFILGLKWRILASKKLDYEQEYQTYKDTCAGIIARNGGNRDLPINANVSGLRLLNSTNVPDTGFGT